MEASQSWDGMGGKIIFDVNGSVPKFKRPTSGKVSRVKFLPGEIPCASLPVFPRIKNIKPLTLYSIFLYTNSETRKELTQHHEYFWAIEGTNIYCKLMQINFSKSSKNKHLH